MDQIITAVYGEMLDRQPLRFLLADDPGAGKTIMVGLLIRELLIRGDLQRCLIVCPRSLAVQWQDELYQKFHLPFEIVTNDRLEAARTGNAFAEMSLVIIRLDKLSRSEELQDKLKQTDERALARDSMDASKVQEIREEMERAEASKLQPHFIGSFFLEAFQLLGGTVRQREPRRYEITNVPAVIRNRDRQIGIGDPILRRYERICFDKELISVSGKPLAAFICPGHPILDATIDLTLERYRELLRQGAILVDESNPSEDVYFLVYLQHAI